jgi:hypothetical protein
VRDSADWAPIPRAMAKAAMLLRSTQRPNTPYCKPPPALSACLVSRLRILCPKLLWPSSSQVRNG